MSERSLPCQLYGLLDAAATAVLEKDSQSLVFLLRKALFRCNLPEQVRAGVNIADRLYPGIAKRVNESVINTHLLPFNDPASAKLIDYGYEQTVFKMDTPFEGYPSSVVKLNKQIIGAPLPRIVEQARDFRRVHQETRRLFGEDSNVVVPEHFLVTSSHVADVPTLSVIQPFIEGEIVDFFNDLTFRQRQQLMEEYPGFGRDVQSLSHACDVLLQQEKRFMDILGDKNVAVVFNDKIPSLKLMEAHLLRGENEMENDEIHNQFIMRVDELRRHVVSEVSKQAA